MVSLYCSILPQGKAMGGIFDLPLFQCEKDFNTLKLKLSYIHILF